MAVAAISAEQDQYCCTKSAKFYNFYAALLILRMTANSAQDSGYAEFWHP